MKKDNDDLFSYSYEGSGDFKEKSDIVDLNSFSSGKTTTENLKKKKKKNKKQKVLKTLLTIFLIGVITCSIVIGTFIVYVFTSVDGTMDEDLNDLKLNFTTTIYSQNSAGDYEEYQRLHSEYNRIWVSYDPAKAAVKEEGYKGIPQNLVNAFVAIEDKRFYEHDGVDWKRTFSAFANLFFHFYSSNQGGSTITQQLVKNLTGDTDQKPTRKMREIMRARYLESHYSKDTIIECYLNTIAMGHGIYGVEVASNYYFNKPVSDLTLNECAALASITKSPSHYSPDDNADNNKKRRSSVLSEMKSQGFINDEEYNAAISEELNVVASKEAINETSVNDYFVDALIVQVTKDLAKQYGYDEKHAINMFYSGGYKIYSTVDPSVQDSVNEVFSNEKAYALKSKDGQTLQGAITVMDYEGNVKGLAGGIGEKTSNLGLSGFNRATDAIRQPGSTMKPIAAYAPAIEQGLINYSSIVDDHPVTSGSWTAVNWYKSYWGNITVQYALERSVNTIPVQLVQKITPAKSFQFLATKLGISTLTAKDMDLSPLGMGGTNGGITTMESAAAYAIFGNGGLYYKPKLYTKVLDQHDNVVLDNSLNDSNAAISEETSTIMNHLLQGVVYGSNGTGAAAAKYVNGMKIYAKTGTSNNSNDLWFVGGTPYYIASCWCGYDNQTAISDSVIALKMWGAVASKIHSGKKAKEYKFSSKVEEKTYCKESGLIAGSGCTDTATGYYSSSAIPGNCNIHSSAPSQSDSSQSSSSEQTSSQE